MKKINVLKIVSVPMVSSRDVVKNIYRELEKCSKKEEFIIDFKGIEIISRSAADEFLNMKSKFTHLEFANLNPELVQFMRTVGASKAVSLKNTNVFKPKRKSLRLMFA